MNTADVHQRDKVLISEKPQPEIIRGPSIMVRVFATVWNGSIDVLIAVIDWAAKRRQNRILANKFINENSKCPGCGHRKGRIVFEFVLPTGQDQDYGKIKHECFVCGARWYEPTVVNTHKWIAKPDPNIGPPKR